MGNVIDVNDIFLPFSARNAHDRFDLGWGIFGMAEANKSTGQRLILTRVSIKHYPVYNKRSWVLISHCDDLPDKTKLELICLHVNSKMWFNVWTVQMRKVYQIAWEL